MIVGFVFYNDLSEQLVVHWNVEGEPDDFVSKDIGIFMIPALMTFLFILYSIMPKIDPKKNNYEKFKSTYDLFINLILILLSALHILVILQGLGYEQSVDKIVPLLIGLMFIVIGNFLPKIKHNYFLGIRTPWTLSDERVWTKTHRLSGRIFFFMGLLLIVTIFLPNSIRFIAFISTVFIGVGTSLVSSYYFFKKDN